MGKPTGFLEYARQGNPCQPPLERVAYWNEFHPRLGREERQRQGARCMACGVPFCQSGAVLNGMVSGCPLHNLVPEWNDLVYRRKLGRALERLLKTNDFPEFTGRVCPAAVTELIEQILRSVLVLALVALLNLFLSALLVVGLPYLVKISLGLSSLHYSFAEAALSLGSIVGGLLSGLVLRGADIRRAWRFLLGTSLLLLPMALALALGIPSLAAYGVILVSVLLGMACAMLFTVSAQTYLQRATPPHLLGKVASFVAAISTCAMPLGQALYGLLFDALQAHVWVVVALGMGASLLVTFSSVRALGRLPALDEAPSGGYTEQSLDS